MPSIRWHRPHQATLGLALVLLDSLVEFMNLPLQQHFEKVGHLRTHHVTHCFEYLGHELRESRGEMCVEGLAERLYQVIPECLIQRRERQVLTPRTGRRMLHGLHSLGGCAVAAPRGGLLWQRYRRSSGGGRPLAPRVARKLNSHLRLSTRGDRHGIGTLRRQPRRAVSTALLRFRRSSILG